jgi:ECF transporter S component (folate family)
MTEKNCNSQTGVWAKLRAAFTRQAVKASFVDFGQVFTDLPKNIVASARELRSIRSLCGIALLLGLSVVVDQFSFYVGPVKIGVGSLISAMLGCFYGPAAGGFAAAAGDIIKFLVRPSGAFFFGYTLNAFLGGMLYGIFFYKMRVSVLRTVSVKLLINTLVNGLLGTLWYSIVYGKGFMAVFPARMITNLTKVPVESIVLLILLPTLIAAFRKAKLKI